MSTATIHHGDALEILAALPTASVHAVVTDPPYGLSNTTPAQVTETLGRWTAGDRAYVPTTRAGGFMGHDWDGFVPPPALWDQVHRVLKPGGHLFTFAGTRTVDLMGTAIRLAGFDLRGTSTWIHSQGMSKAKGQLKPAHEPIIMARKPFPGSATANAAAHGVGTLRTDAVRIPYRNPADLAAAQKKNPGRTDKVTTAVYDRDRPQQSVNAAGRAATDVVFDEAAAEYLDATTGPHRDDVGGPSRFFFVAKASQAERVAVDGVSHPTQKPLSLMRYLVRLASAPGQVIIDPFAGSGTTVEAALLEDVEVIAVEQKAAYLPLIRYRIDRATTVVNPPTPDALF